MPSIDRHRNNNAKSIKSPVVIVGDSICNNANTQTKKLAEFAKTSQFEQLTKEPSHVTKNSKTLIDVAFTNKPEIIGNPAAVHIGISDHSLIFIQRKISIQQKAPKIIKTRQFKNYNVGDFKHDLAMNMQTISLTNDPNEMWNEWKRVFLTVADKRAPLITRRVRSEYAAWITDEIKNMIHHRDILKRKAVKTGSQQFHDAFTKVRNKLIKADYFTNSLTKCGKQSTSLPTKNQNNYYNRDLARKPKYYR